jgi:predicted acyl esterase
MLTKFTVCRDLSRAVCRTRAGATCRTASRGGTTRAPVWLFVMGANAWRDEQEWPSGSSKHVGATRHCADPERRCPPRAVSQRQRRRRHR